MADPAVQSNPESLVAHIIAELRANPEADDVNVHSLLISENG